ncbi:xylene monooxygenase subunit XylM [Pseudomonas sp. MAP12]|uniref:Xylene monooxygenase subunit XylM n=1 Tax=Geopseudomonas aromaticivorans TaxID=2849492 RepID=A0ABS6MX06_9GAMM|nr:xylene monooxygenase subunit XylM [Pseudomonas aromaticivorans]MBV2133343.1 xylene monooxygenase subunit XylM [Pseudomonas aromaticivorans]
MDTLRYYLIPLVTACGVIGFYYGGDWVWLGAATFPLLMVLDIALPRDFGVRKVIPFLADLTQYLQLPLMISLYGFLIVGVNGGRIDLGEPVQVLGCILSLAWLSGVPSLPVSHELMHRRHWLPRRMAQLLATFYGDPNRDIAHVTTHHLELDTPLDSDTPYRGQTIYSFVVTATVGAIKDAAKIEAEILRRKGKSPWNLSNRMYQYVVLLLALPGIVTYFGGTTAGLVAIISMVSAKAIVEAFNYFQHYGLVREIGKPIQLHHAWNHMGMIVRPLGCEITNHINHHIDGYTRFYELRPEREAPQMPSLFVCFLLGLIPPLWFKFIAMPKLKDWDQRYATPGERELAMESNKKAGWPLWVK